MRENGLRAAAYVAVIDLHPQVGRRHARGAGRRRSGRLRRPGGEQPRAAPADAVPDRPAGPAVRRPRRVRDGAPSPRRAPADRPGRARAGARSRSPPEAPATVVAADEPTEPSRDLVDDETWSKIVATFHGGGLEHPAAETETEDPASRGGQADHAWPEAEDVGADGRERGAAPASRTPGVSR